MRTLKKVSILFLTAIAFTSCSNDDDNDNPVPVNEEEVITTITATLEPLGSGPIIVMRSQDLDGDGPNPPLIEVSGPLSANTTYTGNLVILNETVNPAEIINEEIEEEAEDHQFFFQATNGIATFNYVDFDSNDNPLGLVFTLTTSATAGSGVITITLRHELNKDAAGVSDGDIRNAGGETDLQVVFAVNVQ